ncbi:hypothetical protein P872_04670 [Rhodonellum psychrophilum GCM71 = DSM 17998]|uniref:Outer membrane protein beta-barrel domain-containing protein n=2 Tax=Rhodonellum TaxID=336827 RepID=U5C104_9BACT|nr:MULTISPECIES: hypothetical protein [Rhodonellum]ERM82611.1 hypothetical protein P872_04670 [Rhodonellum psychrophilum GCM71 = DSM 17998]SDZ53588.1 hypothetical protein SAMN05444412_12146 [Rhodonellum ikkaensis]
MPVRYRYITLVLFLILVSGSSVLAQRYGTSAGLRLGSNDLSRTVGISVQQRVLKNVTVEGIIQSDFSRNSGMHILLEKHHPIISKRFNYYYGGGFSLGREESFIKNRDTKEITQTYGNATTGIDLIGGIEMTIAGTNISIDYKPNFNMAGREEFFRGQVGISARMVLVKGREQDKKWRKKARDKKRKNRKSKAPLFENLKEKFKRN